MRPRLTAARLTAGRLTAAALLLGVPAAAAAQAPVEKAVTQARAEAAQAGAPAEDPAVYVLRGGTVHTLVGPAIEGGAVVLRDGRIEAVGADLPVPSGAEVIDVSGLHVYPGLVDAFSRLGLTEVDAVSATEDLSELGSFNPHLAAATAVHPASEHLSVARANGITHALTAPGAGGGGGFFDFQAGTGIPGQAVLIHLDGWTVEEMAILPSAAMVIQWPQIQTRSFDFSAFELREKPFSEAEKEYREQVEKMEDWYRAAAHYRQAAAVGGSARADGSNRVRRDLKLEALGRTLGGELPVLVVANGKRAIEDALAFAEEWDLRLMLAGGRGAGEVKEELARKEIPVILGPTQVLPSERDAPYLVNLALAGELHAAGVTIAFSTFDSSDSRRLPYLAANAVPYGLPREAALRAVTAAPAEILGVGEELGTLEAGKIGNLIVTDGDPLEIRTRIEHLFIQGHPVSTDNKHDRLWERYRARPAPEELP